MPSKLIKNGEVIDDKWVVVGAEETIIPQGPVILPVSLWNNNKDQLVKRGSVGIWINGDESPKLIANDLEFFDIVAINFPVFTDGRGFSCARELREQHQYQGEIRAMGNFIRDQMYYLQRCGFNAFILEEGNDLEDALDSLNDFSDSYQASVDQPIPLFRRR